MDEFMFTVDGPQDLRPGDIGFYTIAGRVGGLVSAGQALLDDDCIFTHAYVVVKDDRSALDAPKLMVVEAMPSGARLASLEGRFGRRYGYVRLPLTDQQRAEISGVALRLLGTPYSFADYLALAMWEFRFTHALGYFLTGNALRRYVSNSGRMICSQLVDYVLCKVGFHLFTDGRLSQDVTPGQLWWQAGAVGQAFWWPEDGPAVSERTGSLWPGDAYHGLAPGEAPPAS